MTSGFKLTRLVWVLLFLLFFTGSHKAFSQKFFIGYGMSVYTDLMFLEETADYPGSTSPESTVKGSILTGSLEMKFNLVEFGPEAALSLSAGPSLGTMLFDNGEDFGIGNLKLPVYLQFDYGTLSTYGSVNHIGFGLGIGYEYNKFNLVGEPFIPAYGTLSARAGFRFYNKYKEAREIAFKFGFPKTTTSERHIESLEDAFELEHRIMAMQLSFIMYWNY